MLTLILVHVEETFRHLFPHNFVQMLRWQLPRYYVVHATSMVNDMHPIDEIRDLVDEQIEWGWGYEPEMFGEDERSWLIPSNGHEWTWVPPELRGHRILHGQKQLRLAGGFESECLADMEAVLDNQGFEYKKLRSLVY